MVVGCSFLSKFWHPILSLLKLVKGSTTANRMQKPTQKIAIPHLSGGAEGGGGCPTRPAAFYLSPLREVRRLNAALAEAGELLDGEKAD